MKINSTNQISCKARISEDLKRNVVDYCKKKVLPDQLQEFDKTMRKIGCYGSKTSMFSIIRRKYKNDRLRSYLLFQNNEIIPKKAIVFEVPYFAKVIKFLNALTIEKINKYEALLTDESVPVFKI